MPPAVELSNKPRRLAPHESFRPDHSRGRGVRVGTHVWPIAPVRQGDSQPPMSEIRGGIQLRKTSNRVDEVRPDRCWSRRT